MEGFPSVLALLFVQYILLVAIVFFAFPIKFGVTKQKIVALIATALIALLPVAKANGTVPGCDLYAANINFFFRNVIFHTYLHAHPNYFTGNISSPAGVYNCKRDFFLF